MTSVLSRPILIALLSQVCYSASDLLARHWLRRYGFTPAAFAAPWFAGFLVLRVAAQTGQCYVFATTELGRTAILFGAASMVFATLLGAALLGETITLRAYLGLALALAALVILAAR